MFYYPPVKIISKRQIAYFLASRIQRSFIKKQSPVNQILDLVPMVFIRNIKKLFRNNEIRNFKWINWRNDFWDKRAEYFL